MNAIEVVFTCLKEKNTLVVKPYTFADKEKENYHIITNDEVTEE